MEKVGPTGEKDVAMDQEKVIQWVIKMLKVDQTFTFRKKGNEKQFVINDNVEDQFFATGKHLDNIKPAITTRHKTLEKAKKDLDTFSL